MEKISLDRLSQEEMEVILDENDVVFATLIRERLVGKLIKGINEKSSLAEFDFVTNMIKTFENMMDICFKIEFDGDYGIFIKKQ